MFSVISFALISVIRGQIPRSLFVLALFLVGSARADWTVTSSKTERAAPPASNIAESCSPRAKPTTERRSTSPFFHEIRHFACHRQSDGEGNLAASMRRKNCLAGVNGGYFDPEDKPVGLLISDGNVDRSIAQGPLAERLHGLWRLDPIASRGGVFVETKSDRGAAMRPVPGGSWSTRPRPQRYPVCAPHLHRDRWI